MSAQKPGNADVAEMDTSHVFPKGLTMRRTVVDTVSTIVFFTTVASFTELFIAGMDLREVVTTRLIMVPLMVLTGRPYGIWRDWVFLRIRPTVGWSKAVTDAAAFVVFQLPIYAATLVIAGADTAEIVILLSAVVPQMLILSRPFGLFLEFMRRVTAA